jgi:hypothetical protein
MQFDYRDVIYRHRFYTRIGIIGDKSYRAVLSYMEDLNTSEK